MSASFAMPDLPKDRTRLLACRIDSYAKNRGSLAYAAIAKTDIVHDGFRDITWAQFARAIDRASWWLDGNLDANQSQFECFAYIGEKDLRYTALVVAAIKTGRKVQTDIFSQLSALLTALQIFLPSPFLSITAAIHLFSEIGCKIVAFGAPLPPNRWFDALVRSRIEVRKYQVPDCAQWYDADENRHKTYEYSKSWDEAINDPVLILHSSGTTRNPKPITYRNSTFVYFDTQSRLGRVGPPLAINNFENKRVWSPQPMAHLSGIYEKIIHPVYFHTIPVLSPSKSALTVDLADQMILHGQIVSGFYAPFLIEDFAARPASLRLALGQLESIQYGTAPLNRATANMLYQKLHVQPHYASTELAFPPYLHLPSEDWEYFSFHPFAGIEFRHRLEDLFELVVIRQDKLHDFQVVFTVLQDATIFHSGDLWSPHAFKEGLWRYRGRTDDIIVTSSGANVHTLPIEEAIQEDPRVRAAIVGGQGRPRPFLILEMTQDFYESEDYPASPQQDAAATVWPAVMLVNERLQLHSLATILEDYVIVAPAAKPFLRLQKGSVDRRGTVRAFGHEIDECFRRARSAAPLTT